MKTAASQSLMISALFADEDEDFVAEGRGKFDMTQLQAAAPTDDIRVEEGMKDIRQLVVFRLRERSGVPIGQDIEFLVVVIDDGIRGLEEGVLFAHQVCSATGTIHNRLRRRLLRRAGY